VSSSSDPPVIPNRAARRLLLAAQGLADDPAKRLDDGRLLDLIERMGYVQVDSIKTVERAHHHILFSRNQTYRREQLDRLIDPGANGGAKASRTTWPRSGSASAARVR
jgi:uncharacterized protein YcaQ